MRYHLLLKPRFISDNQTEMQELASATQGGPAMLVGFVERNDCNLGRGLRNALAFLEQGRVAAVRMLRGIPHALIEQITTGETKTMAISAILSNPAFHAIPSAARG